jgi:excisionase family DNA binding protein
MSDKLVDLTDKVKRQKEDIEKKTLSIRELAQVMGIGENTARQLARTKGFPVITIGKRKLVIISKFEEWLEENAGREF